MNLKPDLFVLPLPPTLLNGNPSVLSRSRRAFTLLELLVVVAVVGLLAALLLPALASAKAAGLRVACISNLRQMGLALHLYADDHDGSIPIGPKAPPFTSPSSFYPSTGAPTSLLSLQTGAPVGLGLLLEHYLADMPKVLFCPGSDQSVDAESELGKVGVRQAQGSYYYRHAGNTRMSDRPTVAVPLSIPIHNLGTNRNGLKIRALAIDTQFLSPPSLATFGVKTRTHHQQAFVNVLFADGSAASRDNRDGRFTMDFRNYGGIYDAFGKILGVLEQADAEP